MTRARDKANSTVTNFASTGIDDNADANAITIDSSENVGIGTTSPTASLTVGAADNEGTLRIGDNGTYYGEIKRINASDELRIGHYGGSQKMTLYTAGSERMRIDSGGKVRIGNSSGVYTEQFLVQSDTSSVNPMTVNNTRSSAATDYAIIFGRNGSLVGSIQTSLSATSYVTSSDYRLKTNVSYDWDATSRLKQLKPARFDWISDGDDAVTVDGFLAHEAQTVVPEAVTGTKDEVDDDGNPVMQGIDQAKIVPLLTKALIESVAKIEALEARITALEAD